MPLVNVDAERIRQVVWNLLHNAVKYTRSGDQINLELRRNQDELEVTVSDTGAGIPPEALDRIFEKFQQAHGQMSQHVGGLGLGLALAKEIIEVHGGRIRAESKGLGHGSVFIFTLPIHNASTITKQA
jgi:signal transduction histidine kinase